MVVNNYPQPSTFFQLFILISAEIRHFLLFAEETFLKCSLRFLQFLPHNFREQLMLLCVHDVLHFLRFEKYHLYMQFQFELVSQHQYFCCQLIIADKSLDIQKMLFNQI